MFNQKKKGDSIMSDFCCSSAEQSKVAMPSDKQLFLLSEIFKVFGDSTRIKIVFALLSSELCVQDITTITEASQSAISHQLRILRSHKLVKTRRDGKNIYYSLDDEHVKNILLTGLTHINHHNLDI